MVNNHQHFAPIQRKKAMTILTCASTGQSISLTKKIASSGEGEIWQTDSNHNLAKIYYSPDSQREAKLTVMVNNPPLDPNLHKNHISFAWPKSLLKDNSGIVVGFLMPAIKNGVELINVYNPQRRKRLGLEINWRFLHVTALNSASIIRAIHRSGYVLGDIKPQNILVNNRALPSIIDTDSFQVRDPNTGNVYRCLVGSEGYTPVELLGVDLSTVDQTEIHDRFRIAVIIYHLLFGNHPFMGQWTGSGDSPEPNELISRGLWPYGTNNLIRPGPMTIPLEIVHQEVQQCFLRCFNDGHSQPNLRPTAAEWYEALKVAFKDLILCGKVYNHYRDQNYGKCYWCERANNLGVDIFAASTGERSLAPSQQNVVEQPSSRDIILKVDSSYTQSAKNPPNLLKETTYFPVAKPTRNRKKLSPVSAVGFIIICIVGVLLVPLLSLIIILIIFN